MKSAGTIEQIKLKKNGGGGADNTSSDTSSSDSSSDRDSDGEEVITQLVRIHEQAPLDYTEDN